MTLQRFRLIAEYSVHTYLSRSFSAVFSIFLVFLASQISRCITIQESTTHSRNRRKGPWMAFRLPETDYGGIGRMPLSNSFFFLRIAVSR
jgi:hypothetical protein